MIDYKFYLCCLYFLLLCFARLTFIHVIVGNQIFEICDTTRRSVNHVTNQYVQQVIYLFIYLSFFIIYLEVLNLVRLCNAQYLYLKFAKFVTKMSIQFKKQKVRNSSTKHNP